MILTDSGIWNSGIVACENAAIPISLTPSILKFAFSFALSNVLAGIDVK